jgi:DNA polymerase-3 subunit delta'
LTQEAKNAILKVVEEPPESALIIFIVSQEDNLSPALKSRLQMIYFAPKTDSSKTGVKARMRPLTIDEAIDNIDVFFEDLIAKLRKDPIQNAESLRASLGRLTLIKQFNTNKRLQLRALRTLLNK